MKTSRASAAAAGKSRSRKPLASAEHGTSVKTAFEAVRELIVHGRLAPGSWIIESEIALRLGVSRTPVRAALQWLQKEGYVVATGTGTKSRMTVAPLTREDARELYAIVGHIEGLAGRRTAALDRKLRNELVTELKKVNLQLSETGGPETTGPNRFFDLDARLHNTIFEASAGARLRAIYEAIKPQTERYWRLYSSSITGGVNESVMEHDEIIAAIAKGDADRTERALHANWTNGAERLAAVISMFGERGSW
ncbi:MAG: GntR family transcriptional regulator [Acidobacteriaceae bacterium]